MVVVTDGVLHRKQLSEKIPTVTFTDNNLVTAMGRVEAEARSVTPGGPSGAPAVPPSGVWRAVGLPVLVSGASVSCATACTNPLDVLKVRLQVIDPGSNAGTTPRGMGDALSKLLRNEGPLGLWKGLTPSLARAMCYGGLRLGLYQPILGGVEQVRGLRKNEEETIKQDASSSPLGRLAVGRPGGAWEATGWKDKAKLESETLSESRDTSTSSKIIAGSCSGAFAAALLNPTELVKTRLMANAANGGTSASAVQATTMTISPTLTNNSNNNSSALSVAKRIVHERGVKGLWAGSSMSVTRSAILTASQCAAYDEAKRLVKRFSSGSDDDLLTHLQASMLTGLVTTTVTNPVDMIKTQIYLDAGNVSTGVKTNATAATNAGVKNRSSKNATSAFAAARNVLQKEGPLGFMRGWSANYVRLGPQTVITFVALEQFRRIAGMTAL
ncbi:solute carrier family 25 protein [bacterium]|nr:solute carrier family 25 protein [bacterium]